MGAKRHARRRSRSRSRSPCGHTGHTTAPDRTPITLDQLAAACQAATVGATAPAVAFIDLDRFKAVNDEYGHSTGDQLLRVVAERLRHATEPGDTIARYGGDELVILLAGRTGRQPEDTAQRVLDRLADALTIRGQQLAVHASVGVACWRTDDEDGEALMRRADIALYRAKGEGRGRLVSYDDQLDRDPATRRDLEQELRRALEDDGIKVAYQPIVDLDTNRIRGFEALARWSHAERGPIEPSTFVSLAEEIGQIHVLGRHVLRVACEQMRTWQASLPNVEHLSMHVNVAPAELTTPGFVEGVFETLEAAGLPPTSLTIEVTESTVLADFDEARSALRQLSVLGVGIALDDFGTGYSAMSYLHQLPLAGC